jgi:hypothetical protein
VFGLKIAKPRTGTGAEVRREMGENVGFLRDQSLCVSKRSTILLKESRLMVW